MLLNGPTIHSKKYNNSNKIYKKTTPKGQLCRLQKAGNIDKVFVSVSYR